MIMKQNVEIDIFYREFNSTNVGYPKDKSILWK